MDKNEKILRVGDIVAVAYDLEVYDYNAESHYFMLKVSGTYTRKDLSKYNRNNIYRPIWIRADTKYFNYIKKISNRYELSPNFRHGPQMIPGDKVNTYIPKIVEDFEESGTILWDVVGTDEMKLNYNFISYYDSVLVKDGLEDVKSYYGKTFESGTIKGTIVRIYKIYYTGTNSEGRVEYFDSTETAERKSMFSNSFPFILVMETEYDNTELYINHNMVTKLKKKSDNVEENNLAVS